MTRNTRLRRVSRQSSDADDVDAFRQLAQQTATGRPAR